MKAPKFPLKPAEYGDPLLAYWAGYLHLSVLAGSFWGSIAKLGRRNFRWQATWETFTGKETYVVLFKGKASSYALASKRLHAATKSARALVAAQQEGDGENPPIGCAGCTCDRDYKGPYHTLHDYKCPAIGGEGEE